MKTYADCVPCFLRQALDQARLVSDDPAFHERVVREVLAKVAEMDFAVPPPVMGRDIHRLVRTLSGVDDPYRKDKERFNDYLLSRLPEFRSQVQSSADPFETALRMALAGNVIDFGVGVRMDEGGLERAIAHALTAGIDRGAIDHLRRALKAANNVFYVGDNAGEIVFDRLFLETIAGTLGVSDFTFAVRGAPILNDVTREDAYQTGIESLARVIDNGSDAPGTLLEDCPEEFLQTIGRAGLILAKGQGNYETLGGLEQEAFFLLKAKCPVIARDIGCNQGDLVVFHKGPRPFEKAGITES